MAEKKSLKSQRIVALEKRLTSGEATALADFWREVAEQGTPLVEPDEESEQHRLVTFLWRAQGEETQNVVLRSGPAGWEDPTPHQLARLGETDLWHKTYRLRATTRTTYVLAPNYVFDRDRRKSTDFGTKLLADPLNPRQFIYTKDEEIPDDQETVVSLLELPEAPAQPWSVLRPEVAAGEDRMERQRSELLGNERRVWYYTPAGYDPQRAKPYGLLVLFDGPAYQDLIPTPRILDNLIAAGKIEPIVAVFIDSLNGETRSRELPCHQPFVAFLTQELLPHVRENYHITCDPARTVVAGSSYGGLAAAFVGLRARKSLATSYRSQAHSGGIMSRTEALHRSG